jgi:hypothetical protein
MAADPRSQPLPCRTKIDQWQSYKVPLSFTVLSTGQSNNASFPSSVQLLDVAALPGGDVLVAMAGQHQIWRYDAAAGSTSALSGNGAPRRRCAPPPLRLPAVDLSTLSARAAV